MARLARKLVALVGADPFVTGGAWVGRRVRKELPHGAV